MTCRPRQWIWLFGLDTSSHLYSGHTSDFTRRWSEWGSSNPKDKDHRGVEQYHDIQMLHSECTNYYYHCTAASAEVEPLLSYQESIENLRWGGKRESNNYHDDVADGAGVLIVN